MRGATWFSRRKKARIDQSLPSRFSCTTCIMLSSLHCHNRPREGALYKLHTKKPLTLGIWRYINELGGISLSFGSTQRLIQSVVLSQHSHAIFFFLTTRQKLSECIGYKGRGQQAMLLFVCLMSTFECGLKTATKSFESQAKYIIVDLTNCYI